MSKKKVEPQTVEQILMRISFDIQTIVQHLENLPRNLNDALKLEARSSNAEVYKVRRKKKSV